MKQLTRQDIKQEVFDLYDAYAHNKLERREFVEKLSLYAVGGITISSLMSFMMPNYDAIQIPLDEQQLNTEYITYSSPDGGGEIKAQLSRPSDASAKLPGIIVVHENRGLNPHIEDVGRRAARAGFISLSPDALTPLGGYPGNDDDGRALQKQRDRDKMFQDFVSAFQFLRNHPECNGKIGVVGFCFGGSISNLMAARVPELMASVPFYGGQAPIEEVPNIQCPLMLQFAALDKRVNAGWLAYEEALKMNDKEYDAHFYPQTNHGFHNDTTPRYDADAAKLAWSRTIHFFKDKLK